MSNKGTSTSKSGTTGRAVHSERGVMKRIALISVMLFLSSGCVVVGGYRSGRGWFLWPGPLVIIVVIAVLFLLLRRRGR
jgi:uncharacterized membrane protein YhhN